MEATATDAATPKQRIIVMHHDNGMVEVLASPEQTAVRTIQVRRGGEVPGWVKAEIRNRGLRQVSRWFPRGTETRERQDATEAVCDQFERACALFPGLFAKRENRLALYRLALATKQPLDEAAKTLRGLALWGMGDGKRNRRQRAVAVNG